MDGNYAREPQRSCNRVDHSPPQGEKGIAMNEFFQDWNYKKHAKLCCSVYAVLFALDMTLGYVLAKKLLSPKSEE